MTFDEQRTQSIVPPLRSFRAISALRSQAGVLYPLPPSSSRWMVGSRSSCDVVIEDRCVSGFHCVIERVAHGELVIRDRGSRNGTFLDGHAIEGATLSVGSRLVLGKTKLVALGAEPSATPSAWDSLRGTHPTFLRALTCAEKAATTDCNVLVVGETGTGKDLLARAIHERSRRANGPFVVVNCGAIPRELMASELFGHERGSFTGAAIDRDGYFVQADGGTLFLDELGELPLELQPHLLRALEARMVRRVGAAIERAVDVRVIAATNRVDNLGTEASRLRLDLFHRVASVVIAMPPLRDRLADVKLLVTHFLDEMSDGQRRPVSEEAWEALTTYEWPGNARELRHAVERAVALGDQVLEAMDFFPDLGGVAQPVRMRRITANGVALAAYETALHDEMARALTLHGSIRAAAAAIGMPKSTFADRARHWGLVQPRIAKPVGNELGGVVTNE
jgi:transcriptional regulator with PAS, ATPase and Fis domain